MHKGKTWGHSKNEICSFLKYNINEGKIPSYIEFAEYIERNAMGKIKLNKYLKE
jgi:acyl-CoA synthetase (AMP-forming)/AMP-acid ligase II